MSKKDIFRESESDNSIGFSFEPLPAEEGEDYPENEKNPKKHSGGSKKQKGGKNSMSRLLLLILLLVVLGGAGFYLYLNMFESPTPPQPTPVAVQKKPIAAPPKKPEKKEEPAPLSTPAAKPVPEQVTEKPVNEAKTEAVTPPPPAQAPPTVASVAPPEVPKSPEAAPMVTPPPPSGRIYTVQAGAFLLKSNLARSEKKIRALGYEPKVTIKKKKVPVTRLRVGDFSIAEGKAELARISKFAPDAYTAQEGNRLIVYAGSYVDIDRARSISDRLYEKGIQIEEETVNLPRPLHILSFGEFPDLKSAREAAARAKKAGMDVFVSKDP